MKLHALINHYNDPDFIAATLRSLADFVDRIVIADGAYELYYPYYKKYNPDAQPWSNDGSLEIVTNLRGLPELEILRMPEGECWPNQTVKRTALLDAVPNEDWFIVIDSDEMLMGDKQEAMEQIYNSGCIVAQIPIYLLGTDVDRLQPYWHPKIFQKKEGMKYIGTHWNLCDKYGRLIEEWYPLFWTDMMVLTHFKAFKSQARLIPHQEYMAELQDRRWFEPMVK